MKRQALKKLISHAGESIGETLVALLISALALMMLAGAVSAGMRVVENSKKAVDDYYAVNNSLAAREDSATISDGSTVAVKNPGTLSITVHQLLPTGTIPPVIYWKNEQLSGVPVIAYSMP